MELKPISYIKEKLLEACRAKQKEGFTIVGGCFLDLDTKPKCLCPLMALLESYEDIVLDTLAFDLFGMTKKNTFSFFSGFDNYEYGYNNVYPEDQFYQLGIDLRKELGIVD